MDDSVGEPGVSRGNAERRCGDCHACCIRLPIPAGEVSVASKPAGIVCPNLTVGGCRIYARRPETCRRFQCAWLAETSWPVQWRPERSGLLCLREDVEDGLPAALVYEIKADALLRPAADAILAKLQGACAVVAIVNLHGQRRLIRGHLWVDSGDHGVARPHFLKPINAKAGSLQGKVPLRDAS